MRLIGQELEYLGKMCGSEERRMSHFSGLGRSEMTSILFRLIGFCFGVFVQAGGGILAGVFHLTPWLTLWWGIGITVYTIAKDYWLPGGKGFGYQPHWVKGLLLTIPWGIVLHTGINYGIYLILHWTIHVVHG